ncbi:helix-turn-helix domain containing protein [Bifidobacterium sp. ESL0690]|uniref:TetR/AcrR family transcriptional regulator n=1 Tax=Bifidobacterium sp. ESL0690 TaxID=2983214 RepID=UPI0023F91A18|nr:helix-turn-helix domain-containing protein [Bifidobacterium sp. ESL0690]WEV47451.1 helix-turn-helix domain containing protein [Bifidobacterium sp. ESL0690]
MARPRSFDEHQVLERCRKVFCTRGYDATSIDDLVSATGLKRGSLYQAFGSKRGVFLKVLQGALDATTENKATNKAESGEGDSIPAEAPSPSIQSEAGGKTIRSEPQFLANSLFSVDVLTLVTIACLELAPHDAKVRDIIVRWRSLIPREQADLLPQTLGDNLLNRAGIGASSTKA